MNIVNNIEFYFFKKNNNHRFLKPLFFIICLGMVINDLPVQNVLGTLGASPIWAISLLVFLILLVHNKYCIYLDKYSKLFVIYFILSFIVSFIQCAWYYFSDTAALSYLNFSVFSKHVFASSYYLVYFFVIYCANNLSKINPSVFKVSIIFISVFLVLVMFVEYFSPDVLAPLHLSMDGYGIGARLRILSPEPSIAAFTFNIFLLLAILLANNKALKMLFLFLLFVGNILIGSKSSLALIMTGGLLVFWLNLSFKQRAKYLVIFMPIAGLIIYYIVHFVLPALLVDIEKFTSVSTRLITAMWAVLSLVYYPLGEGYGTYMVYFVKPLDAAISLVGNLVPFSLNLTEVNDIINTGENLSAKSGILFSIIHSGFIAVVFYFFLFKSAFKDIQAIDATHYQKILLRIMLWYTILSIFLTVNIEVLYAFLLPFITINYLKTKSIGVR